MTMMSKTIHSKFLLIAVCFWGLVLLPRNTSAQLGNLTYAQSVAIFGEQRIFEFRRFSLELTDESKASLHELVEVIRRFPAIMHKNVLVIQTFTCEKELNVKPYIAACRGQVIIDYLVEAVDMPRKKCFIQDGGPNTFDPDCHVASGVNMYLKPAW